MAKIEAATIVMVGLLLTLDPVTPSVLLTIEVLLLPASGVTFGILVRRTWPLLLAAAGIAVANLLVVDGGRQLFSLGLVDVTSEAVKAAAATALRLLAIALPGILVLASTDPLDLADALVQRWHLPSRFAYGALAALRLLPLLSLDWHQVARARRARGLDAGRSPAALLRTWFQQVFAILVSAVRRGVRLATAMEARGFGATGVARTVARPQPMHRRDYWLLGLSVMLVVLAHAVAVVSGQWRPPLA